MRVRPAVVGLVAAALALAGCATVPDVGPIHEIAGTGPSPESAPFDFSPAGPRSGASRQEIADGFLTAMLATPVNTFVARSFLTTQSASSWAPDKGTIIFDSRSLAVHGDRVTVTMENPRRLDAQGRWMGASRQRQVSLDLVKEKGEWRISDPPNALMISTSHFQARFQQYSIYFFDPSGHVLVPEPVFVPWGVQAATRLVTALLLGPPPGLERAERTYFPPTTDLDVSVPVIANGVADVPLIASAGSLSGAALQRATAQIAWTLRQVPGVSKVRLTVGGQPLDLPGMDEGIDVSSWRSFSPAVSWATTDLYGLRGSSVVRVSGVKVSSAGLGPLPPGGRYVSVGLDLGGQAAAVVDGGSRVYEVASREQRPKLLYQGHDVLRPSWDIHDNVWIYDRADPDSVRIFPPQGSSQVVPLGLPAGFVADSVSLSRDGSRYLLGGSGGVWAVRVDRSQNGRVEGFTAPSRILRAGPGEAVTSLAWQSPTQVAGVLVGSGTQRLLALFSVDGSMPAGDTSAMPSGVTTVAAEPDGAGVIYSASGSRLYQRNTQGSWRTDSLSAAITAATFAG